MTEQEYKGLLGEIVTEDIYKMRKVADVVSVNDPTYVHWKGHDRGFNFEPDFIVDLGANVGVFTKYCMQLYPNAKVVAVEPDDDNLKSLSKLLSESDKLKVLPMAIGSGKVWRHRGAINGAHESYVTESVAFKEGDFAKYGDLELVEQMSITVADVINSLPIMDQHKLVVKVDIEGNEISVFEHEPSMKALKRADYLVMELHWCALRADDVPYVRKKTIEAMEYFKDTHDCFYEHIYFYAVKKR